MIYFDRFDLMLFDYGWIELYDFLKPMLTHLNRLFFELLIDTNIYHQLFNLLYDKWFVQTFWYFKSCKNYL